MRHATGDHVWDTQQRHPGPTSHIYKAAPVKKRILSLTNPSPEPAPEHTVSDAVSPPALSAIQIDKLNFLPESKHLQHLRNFV